jgi:hypothetical protein
MAATLNFAAARWQQLRASGSASAGGAWRAAAAWQAWRNSGRRQLSGVEAVAWRSPSYQRSIGSEGGSGGAGEIARKTQRHLAKAGGISLGGINIGVISVIEKRLAAASSARRNRLSVGASRRSWRRQPGNGENSAHVSGVASG